MADADDFPVDLREPSGTVAVRFKVERRWKDAMVKLRSTTCEGNVAIAYLSRLLSRGHEV